MREPLAVPPGLHRGRPPNWRPPPPRGWVFTEKEIRERKEAIEHRFESYDVMWARIYKLAQLKESETSKLLKEAIQKATDAADLDSSTGFEFDVPRRMRQISLVFAEHTENAQDAMDALGFMLDLESEHATRGSRL